MNQPIVGLNCFRQRNEDGSSFISCSGSINGEAVEFTLPDAKVKPVATGKIYPIANKPNRFVVPVKEGIDIFVVNPRDAGAISALGAKKIFVDGLDHIVVPTDDLWEVAARKPVAQAQATGTQEAGLIA